MDKRYTPVYDLVYQLKSLTYGDKRHEITLTDKCIYSYIYYRYVFFSAKGCEYFDNQQAIADHLGTTTRSVTRSIKKLEELGLVVIDRRGRSNNYIVKWIEDVNLLINDQEIDF